MTWLPRGTRRAGTAVGVRDGGGAEAAPIRFRRQASSRGRATRVSVIRCVRACGPPGTRGQQVHMMTIFTQVHKIIHFTEGLRQRTPSPNPAFVSALRASLAARRAQHPLPESVPMPRPRLSSGLFLRNHAFLHSTSGAPACGAPSGAHLWLLLRLLGLCPPLFPRPQRPSLAPLFFLVPLPTG